MFFSKPILVSLCCVLVATGCSDDDDDERRPISPLGTGTLQFSWTIDGRSDPAACDAAGATAFEVQIFDQGYFVSEAQAPCDEFETSIELYADDYVSRATLVDAEDFSVTRRVVEDFFLIQEDEVTQLSVDFPTGIAPEDPDAGVTEPTDAGAAAPNGTDPEPTDAGAVQPEGDAGGAGAAAAP